MGSSKKVGDDKERERERDRERERERERKKRKRERERSKSRDRGRDRSRSKDRGDRGRDRSRERGRDRSRSNERKRSRKERERSHDRDAPKRTRSPDRSHDKRIRSPERSHDRKERREREDMEKKGRGRAEAQAPPSSGRGEESVTGKGSSAGDLSLSIEETNKLRLSLGLKPLEVDGASKKDTETDEGKPGEEVVVKKDAIHAPPKNIGQLKAAEALKEKIATRKEARKISKALVSLKTLGEKDDDDVEESSLWVEKLRRMAEDKKKAEKKAQMLAEMDEEFGVGDIISEVTREEKKKAYGSHDLKGIKVEHDVSSFKEGRDTTLIIKDTGVLEEEEDILMNINMLEAEKAVNNVELKKGKPGYNPYDREEVDEEGNLKEQSILSKYDEEIEGEKKKMFKLGHGGAMDNSAERERELIRQKLMEKRVTLATAPLQQASEYFTSEEMVQFKKPKKKRKVLRKKEKIKADDLLPLGDDDTNKDHGSRSRHGDGTEEMEVGITLPAASKYGDDLKDEGDINVDNSLTRTRRLLKRPRAVVENVGATRVLNILKTIKKEERMEEGEGEEFKAGLTEDSDIIVLNTTAEFCKQVGEDEKDAPLSTDGHHGDDYRDNVDDDMDIEEEGGWTEVKVTHEKKKAPQSADLYQKAEPMVSTGVAATLQLATQKGFVDVTSEKKKKKETKPSEPVTARRDIEYERQKEKERDRELSRFGRESAFPEKKSYVPNVRIEYVDDSGRVLNTKEAFRYMSHKFHGRGSGRKKLEKRLKKYQDEHLLKTTSSTDTPLNTLSVLKSKQKASQSPYILVSGGAQSLLAPDIAKRK